jgi:hypothetical protein
LFSTVPVSVSALAAEAKERQRSEAAAVSSTVFVAERSGRFESVVITPT